MLGLGILILGLAIFLGAHIFVTFRDDREQMIARLGWAATARCLRLRVVRAGADRLGLCAVSRPWLDRGLVAAGLHAPHHRGADAVCGDLCHRRLHPRPHQAQLKHPMLVGVKTWALAHLLSNGDLGSIVLFGSFLAWGVYDRIAPSGAAISARRRRRPAGPTTSSSWWSASSSILRSASSSTLSSSACRCSGVSACRRKTRSSG